MSDVLVETLMGAIRLGFAVGVVWVFFSGHRDIPTALVTLGILAYDAVLTVVGDNRLESKRGGR